VSDDNPNGPVDRALDVFVYAPLGLALLARDSVPGLLQAFAARGRAEVDARRQAAESKVEQARAVGRLAVDYGTPVVRRRVEDRLNDARERAEQTFTGLVVGRDDRAPTATQPVAPVAPVTPVTPVAPTPAPDAAPLHETASTSGSAPDYGAEVRPSNGVGGFGAGPARDAGNDMARPTLSIPDYDELSASQVVQRLPGLSNEELAAIRAYETHGRGRRTILGKIDQLAR
jgi:hypothetical protein